MFWIDFYMFCIDWKFNAIMKTQKEFRELAKNCVKVFISMLEKRTIRLDFILKLLSRLYRLAREDSIDMEYQSLRFETVLRIKTQRLSLETQTDLVFMLIRCFYLQDSNLRNLLRKTLIHYDLSKTIKYVPEITISTQASTIDL